MKSRPQRKMSPREAITIFPARQSELRESRLLSKGRNIGRAIVPAANLVCSSGLPAPHCKSHQDHGGDGNLREKAIVHNLTSSDLIHIAQIKKAAAEYAAASGLKIA